MRLAQSAVVEKRPRPAAAPSQRPGKEPDSARTENPLKKCRKEKAVPERTASMRRLRSSLRSTARPGVCRRARAYTAHFLHTLPLLWSDNHNKLRHEDVVLHRSPRQKVITYLHVGHGDCVAALAQRSVFIQFDRLRHIVRAHHRNLWRVDRLYFARDVGLTQRASLHVRATAIAIGGTRANRLRGPSVIGIFLAAHRDHVADFEVAALGRLTVLAKFGLRRELDGHGLAVGIRNLERRIMSRGDLAEQKHAAP